MGNKLLVWIARLCVCMSLGSSFLVAPLFAQFVYVANTGFNHSVSGLRINATTGALTIVPGSPFPADPSPTSIAVDPSGRFVYVPSNTANTISGYTINPASGALTPIPGSPFPAGNVGLSGTEPSAIIVDPTGKFAYAMNSNANFVSGYKINATSGALTPIPVSPCSTGGAPRAAAINSTGRLIYVVDGFNVFGCLIDPLTGALTPLLDSPFPGGAAPISIRVHVSGKFVYVLDAAGFIRRYAADPNSGMLTFLDATEVPGGNNFLPELHIRTYR